MGSVSWEICYEMFIPYITQSYEMKCHYRNDLTMSAWARKLSAWIAPISLDRSPEIE